MMHWNLDQILWALVLASHLVLLIVLMGRDRARRFPWFTASIAFSAVRLIADHLLNGKLATVYFFWQTYLTLLVGSVLTLLVLAELARCVFASGRAGLRLNARGWTGWTLVIVGIAAAVTWVWAPWPVMKELAMQPAGLRLGLVGLAATRSVIFVQIATIEVAILIFLFGKRFGFGAKSHAWRITAGLSTYALSYVFVDRIQNSIVERFRATARTAGHHVTQAEYDHTVKLLNHLGSAVLTLWLVVLLWWIASLWRDETGMAAGLSTVDRGGQAGREPEVEVGRPERGVEMAPGSEPEID